jgi:hypothetical protein
LVTCGDEKMLFDVVSRSNPEIYVHNLLSCTTLQTQHMLLLYSGRSLKLADRFHLELRCSLRGERVPDVLGKRECSYHQYPKPRNF